VIILQLLEITPAESPLEGVVMELSDCASRRCQWRRRDRRAETAFRDIDYAGWSAQSRADQAGTERKDRWMENAKIFSTQGKALTRSRSAR
jgi:malate/lactate dehydrogenase